MHKWLALPAASESVALSIAAGMAMAGGKPIVLVQSSGFANMASGLSSLIQPYGIKFPIITSWRTYEAGDSEIQHAVLAENLPDFIQACGFDYELIPQENEEEAVTYVMESFNDQYILVLQADTFSKVSLLEEHKTSRDSYVARGEFLNELNKHFGGNSGTTFIGTTGATSREMATLMPDTKNFYMAGNMGNALSVGVGAWMQGRDVIVLGGDAESLMHLGGLATAARITKEYTPSHSLTYVVMNNESNFTTGGQVSPASFLDLVEIFEGFVPNVVHAFTPDDLISALEEVDSGQFQVIVVECGFDPVYPRPSAEAIINSVNSFK